jgi:hypothetical protein
MRHVYYRGRERNDCSVSAAAKATGLEYEASYAAHAAQGRRRRGRTKLTASIAAVSALGYRVEEVEIPAWRTLREIVDERLPPRGAYLGHFLSVVDGVVYDHKVAPTRRVLRVYRVTPIAKPVTIRIAHNVTIEQLELQLEAA